MHKAGSKKGSGVETETDDGQKGVIPRLLGVVAIILGFLNSMLSWRGGFAIEPFYVALVLGGAVLYITGSLARKR